MGDAALIAVATFAHVFARAFQQLNVIHNRVWWVPPTTLVIAICDVVIIVSIVKVGWTAVAPLTVGGTMGVIAAMWTHRRWRKE